ncbi:type II secretion system protein [Caulobacter sp. Root655]|uniref:type II secretion system protein n=1 Tax=Caulobacter sp. Root655 TaxID=1736578 RepID=UPI0009E8D1B6|nr:type II secretion system protein [Caulobacter sp. Root655]
MARVSRGRRGSRAGFSLLEMLIVLAIMALAVALVMPRGAVLLDRMTAQTVFFDFQRQVGALRRDAADGQASLLLVDSDAYLGAQARFDGRATLRVVDLGPGWTYRLTRPIAINEGGACANAGVTLMRDGKPIMHLAPAEAPCRFTRLD